MSTHSASGNGEHDIDTWIREGIANDIANGDTLDLFAAPELTLEAEVCPRVAEGMPPASARAATTAGVTQ